MTNEEIINAAIELEFGPGTADRIKAENKSLVNVAKHVCGIMVHSSSEPSSSTIKCWIGRDEDYSLRVFTKKPDWLMDHWRDWDSIIKLDCQSFPEIGQGEIIEVELMFRPL